MYQVGRENAQFKCDIYVPKDADTVSRHHLELTVTEDGQYFLNDLNSASGTFRRLPSGKWERMGQGYVELEEPIRLGKYETSVSRLLSLLPPPPKPKPSIVNPTDGRYYIDEDGKVKHE